MSTLTTQKSRKETHAEKVARLLKLSKEAKASGCTRCKSWDDFFTKLGLRAK